MAQHPLTRYIETRDVGRTALAKAAGTTRQTIHRIERGEQSPSLEMIGKLIEATNGVLRADDFMPRRETAA